MTALIGLTAEHNAEVARLKQAHPEVKLPSLFTEIFELPKMATSTPERKAKQEVAKSPILDASRDSLDLSTGLEPVSPPGKLAKIKQSQNCLGSFNPYDTDFNFHIGSIGKDTSDYGTSANSSDIDSGTNRYFATLLTEI